MRRQLVALSLALVATGAAAQNTGGFLPIAPVPSLTAAPPKAPVPETILTPSTYVPPTETSASEIASRVVDPAFGAYQRGFYQTALTDAQKRLANDPNDAASLTLLGQIYTEGVAVPRDLSRAADYYRRAAARGDTNGMFALGVALLAGRGVAVDRAEARKLFEAAAAHNHPGALYNLGVISIESQAAPDFAAAVTFFRRAADAGSADAAYSLGILYRQGRGVERDDRQAVSWFKRAADEGNIFALVEYGIMAFNGAGMTADESIAARAFLKAAQKNNPVAQNRAARLLVAGRGITADPVEGLKWHVLARSAGVTDLWLDGQLATLNTAQRGALEDAVRKFSGM